MASTTAKQLATHERRYRQLLEQLSEIGYIRSGSLAPRYNYCGKPNCRCHGDPPQPHGPYYQWTAKVNGKTINRRLNAKKPRSTSGGSTTTGAYAPSSTNSAPSQPKPPRSSSNRPATPTPRFNCKLRGRADR